MCARFPRKTDLRCPAPAGLTGARQGGLGGRRRLWVRMQACWAMHRARCAAAGTRHEVGCLVQGYRRRRIIRAGRLPQGPCSRRAASCASGACHRPQPTRARECGRPSCRPQADRVLLAPSASQCRRRKRVALQVRYRDDQSQQCRAAQCSHPAPLAQRMRSASWCARRWQIATSSRADAVAELCLMSSSGEAKGPLFTGFWRR